MKRTSLTRGMIAFGLLSLIGGSMALIGCGGGPSARPDADVVFSSAPVDAAASIPRPMREFRAGWVATVANIDWPSKRTLTVAEQQAEIIAILDKAKELNLNAIVFQVRPSGDALYQSELEPWSEYLTGTQGKAPEPFYDPLAMWVKESHARGIELHAWFNPYRAKHPNQKTPNVAPHISVTRPDLVKSLAEGYEWMDPAEPEIQRLSLDVVLDVVRRYDIDGVHFDDYFYPYKSYHKGEDFPDSDSWNRYRAAGGTLSRDDWRRDAVNKFVKSIHEEVRKERNTVRFGMSPFGIWRPGFPPSIKGMDQYNELYADAKLWLNEGWVDYWTPQLYWTIDKPDQSFPVLLKWWMDENTKGVHLWPGLATYRAGDEKWADAGEVIRQVQISRDIVPNGPGQVHFSFKVFQSDKAGVATRLLNESYSQPAIPPATPWLDSVAPDAPLASLRYNGEQLSVSWTPQGEEKAFLYVVYTKHGETWSHQILPAAAGTTSIILPKDGVAASQVAVSSVDRTGNESELTILAIPTL